jgi:hypothetical protein
MGIHFITFAHRPYQYLATILGYCNVSVRSGWMRRGWYFVPQKTFFVSCGRAQSVFRKASVWLLLTDQRTNRLIPKYNATSQYSQKRKSPRTCRPY